MVLVDLAAMYAAEQAELARRTEFFVLRSLLALAGILAVLCLVAQCARWMGL
ncbi:hypothetical protein [Novosphingobium pituita]|uniref:Uncharacterized protein n=1 Tax=Novosphingobium pituita TaxID=3056842 RepID=A0ABQ6PCT7_9SPHN|nr:hypothetical protein [Novosphingobium sp. IK01]GMM62369.1 hypothetical protein NUTIK01_31460 [Novosphingobium sp. IK01]